MPKLPVEWVALSPPSLESLRPFLESTLKRNFNDVSVTISQCPDLRLPPFGLAAPGICGHARIADVGGPPYLHPFPSLSKKYDLLEIADLLEIGDTGSMMGAGAGPFHVLGQNAELMPNLSWQPGGDRSPQVTNLSMYAMAKDDGEFICRRITDKASTTAFGLMANLFCSDGDPGDTLHIVAKGRKGELNFTQALQQALRDTSGPEEPISMGGVFLIKNGKAWVHVMPDFSKTALETEADVRKWLRFYEIQSPIVCLTVLHSHDPGLNLRMEHTHCFSEHGEGGHYHGDTTPLDVVYEAYLNVAQSICRIDRP